MNKNGAILVNVHGADFAIVAVSCNHLQFLAFLAFFLSTFDKIITVSTASQFMNKHGTILVNVH